MKQPIRVILADDHVIFRVAVGALLSREPGVEVVAEAADGRTAVRLARELCADVVVMDVSMPELNGVDATRQINGSGSRVLALSAHTDARTCAQMLKAGAAGYLSKSAALHELIAAIHCIAGGTVYINPAAAGALLTDLRDESEITASERLSPREREVLQLVAEGKATKEIAVLLGITTKTVETHRRNIMEKLLIDNVAGLTKYAIREGLTALNGCVQSGGGST